MLLGMPVLSSSVGGVKTLIQNGVTGYLFNPYDKYDLAGLLIHTINNYSEAVEVGKNARKVAMERHSPDSIIKRLMEIYSQINLDK
jgi:glycosyltransferase involved in cell wall biosynthesis